MHRHFRCTTNSEYPGLIITLKTFCTHTFFNRHFTAASHHHLLLLVRVRGLRYDVENPLRWPIPATADAILGESARFDGTLHTKRQHKCDRDIVTFIRRSEQGVPMGSNAGATHMGEPA